MENKKETIYLPIFSDTHIMKYNGNAVKRFKRVTLIYVYFLGNVSMLLLGGKKIKL